MVSTETVWGLQRRDRRHFRFLRFGHRRELLQGGVDEDSRVRYDQHQMPVEGPVGVEVRPLGTI
jgi:hypothetical protein